MRIVPAFTITITSFLLIATSCKNEKAKESEQLAESPKEVNLYGFNPDTLNVSETKIKNGETFIGLMNRLGLGTADASTLVRRSGEIFNVRSMRAGADISAYYGKDTLNPALRYVVYHRDKIHKTVFVCFDSLQVRKADREVVSVDKFADILIENSLYADADKAGVPIALAWELSDIYAWNVDFFSLRKGDRFRAFYTVLECDGEYCSVDKVDFAVFSRDGKNEYAIRLDTGDGGNKFWNEKGESLRKSFLKAPLHFRRISSTFSYARKHPITGKVRPHTGVDYAAPAGTPVVALGDGTVINAYWDKKGGGNTIKIRHNSVYTTAYLHLRGFAKGIKGGVRVHQGQTIGYVGSTGASTGPHLDFRVWKNGTPINPLKMESPSAEPLKKEFIAQLDSLYTSYKSKL